MKEGIHPKYEQTTIRCACGEIIETGSTKKDIKAEKKTIDLNKREIHRLQKEFEEKQTGLNLGGALSHWMGYSVLPLLQRIAMACKSM